jgi:Domain of unknown function (DUF6458)
MTTTDRPTTKGTPWASVSASLLLAVGAILAFAVHATVAGVDIRVVGWILMAAGALGPILTMIVFAPRQRRTVTETRSVAAEGSKTAPPQNVVEREVRDDGI